jgi:hypothetical protein
MSTPRDIQAALGKSKHPVEAFKDTGPDADPSSHPRAERRSSLQLAEVLRVEVDNEFHHKLK